MKSRLRFAALVLPLLLVFASGLAAQDIETVRAASNVQDRTKLPMPLSPFTGKIGETYKDSRSAWQSPPTAPSGAPNVIIILLDDVGFGQSSAFGGLVPMPNLEKLASEGLRFNDFHTTGICGPSRSALLTGRNHHDAGNGFLMEWATGFPEYSTMIPKDTATIGEILKDNGYSTWWFGKNHNTPDWETSVAGPFDRWPTGMGFEYFYGFNAGETDQWYPVLFENTTPVEPDKTPAQGYHFMTDMTDRAIARMKFFKSMAPQKPFFMYFAPGAAHAPHEPPKEWREKFKGKFDMGWDKYRDIVYQQQLKEGIIPANTQLTKRPDWVKPWDSLNDDQKKVYSALMENFAGYLSFTDHEIGRLLDAVRQLPDANNTLVIYIVGDNGASAEGGPDGTLNEIKSLNGLQTDLKDVLKNIDRIGEPGTEPHYPIAWAWAGDTPFQWVKQVASHLGATRNPMVAWWPAKIKHDDKPRDAFVHLVDVLPTVLDAAHIPMPDTVNGVKQYPLAGKSFLAAFTNNDYRGRNEQYFEILSNRSIYLDGWKADAQHTFPWRQDLAPGNWDKDRWELYNLHDDFSEANDLASKMPEKLAQMKAEFDKEAKEFHVYPLDDRGSARLSVPKPPVTGSDPNAKVFSYAAGATRIPETAAPPMKNRSWKLVADVKADGAQTSGVILGFGGTAAGLTLYLDKGVPVFDYNYFEKQTAVRGKAPLKSGASTIEVDFDYLGKTGELGKGANITLKVDGAVVGTGKLDHTVAGRFGIDTFGVGEDTGQPVTPAYDPPFKYTGDIDKVVISVK